MRGSRGVSLCTVISRAWHSWENRKYLHCVGFLEKTGTCKPQKQLFIVCNYVRTLWNYAWLLQRSSEILECVIVSSVVNDCLVLSQYDLHRGSFLLATPIIMSRYKCTIIHCKSTSLRWRAVLSKLCFCCCKFFRYYLTSKRCIKFISLVFTTILQNAK